MYRPRRVLKANELVGVLMVKHYRDAQTKRPHSWLTMAPNPLVEICYAAGISTGYPEHYGCVCAARHVSSKYCEVAESVYTPDICSYIKNMFGYMMSPGESPPLGGLPTPDVLMVTPNACVEYFKWWDTLRVRLGKPMIVIDIPQVVETVDVEYYLDYVMAEVESAISETQQLLGVRVDEEKLVETVRLSDELTAYWHAILELEKAVPAPVGFNDLNNLLFLVTAMPGTPEAVKVAKKAYEEMKQRVDEGRGVVEEEKHRLLFFNIPPWYALGLMNYLEDRGAVVVLSDYVYHVWATIRLDPSKPIESLARKALSVKRADELLKVLLRDVKEYRVDGVIIHSNRSCRVLSMGLLDIARALHEAYGIPVLNLEMDHVDERVFSQAEVLSRVEGFLEMLG